ncbi:hypothetical protein M569_06241, partial [Genlisea aurea]
MEADSSSSSVAFHKLLFGFADPTDKLLMLIGTVSAAANGANIPLTALLFGNLMDAFGRTTDPHQIVHAVSKVALKFVYLAVGSGAASFLQVSCWMIVGERQAARIRNLYLKKILQQEVAFFDKETSTGEVVARMSGDTVLIQDAIGEKVGKFIQLTSTFVGGFTVAFIRGWLLTLVLLSVIPVLMVSGGLMFRFFSKMSSLGQTAYANAAVVVEQTIGSIRTVASFTGEKQAVSDYEKSLSTAYKSGVRQGFTSGLGFGVVMFLAFSCYAMAIWFGARMILYKGYTGGQVANVIVALLTAAMSLGQTAPCVSAFSAGKAAAFKMFETLNRTPAIDAYDTRGVILDDILRGD